MFGLPKFVKYFSTFISLVRSNHCMKYDIMESLVKNLSFRIDNPFAKQTRTLSSANLNLFKLSKLPTFKKKFIFLQRELYKDWQ